MIIPVTMRIARLFYLAPVMALILILLAACGGDDSDSGSPSPSSSDDPGVSGSPTSAPSPGGDPIVPPLEGPASGPPITEETDWRLDPEWAPPDPADVPEADDPDNPVLNPPAVPVCPEEWVKLTRHGEGFEICYPLSWVIGSHGYVASANESRWYSVGIFDFSDAENQIQRAHVSVYMFPQFSRPVRYTIDCPEARGVEFSGEPAVVCPEFPGIEPEAEIISYHVFKDDRDYFVNVATYYEYDAESEEYTDDVAEAAREIGLQIAHSFKFIPLAQRQESNSPAP
jgi:hypothetical protein